VGGMPLGSQQTCETVYCSGPSWTRETIRYSYFVDMDDCSVYHSMPNGIRIRGGHETRVSRRRRSIHVVWRAIDMYLCSSSGSLLGRVANIEA